MHFELRNCRTFEALHQHQVARRESFNLLFESMFALAAQLVHQHPAFVGRDQHLARTRLAMTKRVLARFINVKGVVRMLDQ